MAAFRGTASTLLGARLDARNMNVYASGIGWGSIP